MRTGYRDCQIWVFVNVSHPGTLLVPVISVLLDDAERVNPQEPDVKFPGNCYGVSESLG